MRETETTWPPEPLTAPIRRETRRELVARERRERENPAPSESPEVGSC